MEFMLIFLSDRDTEMDESIYEEMGKFAMDLASQGKIRGGSPLYPEEEGARVRVRRGKQMVTDGPFTETKEVIGGFVMIDCKDRKEAIAIAKRCPHNRGGGIVEVRQVFPVGGEDDGEGDDE